MKKIYLLLFLCANVEAQQQKIEKFPKPSTIQIQIETAKKDSNFISAENLLKEEGLELNFKTARINTINKSEYQIIFDIIDPNNFFDYRNLIFIKLSNKSLAAFENFNSNFSITNQSAQAKLFGCQWGNWQDVAILHQCWHNGWCAKNQYDKREAWYKYQEKLCIKNGNIMKTKTRWKKEEDGCKCD